VPVELGHERLAEPHDLALGPALGIEVRATLAAADRQTSKGVLEDLLEPEELHDADVDAGVEAEPTLVGAEGRVELHPEAAVELDLAGIVDPRDPEDDLALRLAEPADHGTVGVLRVLGDHRPEAVEHLVHRLVELRLTRVAPQHFVVDVVQLLVEDGHWSRHPSW
jgi:hypothetical protein